MDLNNLILILLIICFGLFFYIFFLPILYKKNPKILVDDKFNKPQAFHEFPISIAGGVGIFIPLLGVFINFILFKDIVFF